MQKSWRGWAIIILFSILPAVIWMTQPDAVSRFGDLSSILLSAGQFASLIGIAMFSISFWLSLRVAWLEEYFDGMNRVYQAHHTLGGISFMLLLLHPVFLIPAYASGSWKTAAAFLLPGNDWTINIGIAALLSLMALLIITYYLDLPYQLWRYTHKYLGGVFFLGILHAFFVSSDILRYPPLWWYMAGICFLGALSYAYRTVLGKVLVPRYSYHIEQIIHDSGNVVELLLRPDNPDRIMHYIAGQFVFLSLSAKGAEDTDPHPFSISSSPTSGIVRLSIKALGDYSTRIGTITEGMPVTLEGPFGRFSYLYNPNTAYIWIAGGIGVTPFVSMAHTLTGVKAVDLYYCAKDESESAHIGELETISSQIQNFRVIPWYSAKRGRLTAELIRQTSGLEGKEIFICGPAPMMHALTMQLKRCGVKQQHIHTEEFGIL